MKNLLIAATLALLSGPVAVYAAPNDGLLATSRIEVSYSDLNLNHPAGAAAMLARIKHAAVRVCGGAPQAMDIRDRKNFRDCVAAATRDAVRQLNAPLVTALFTGEPDPRLAAR